MIISREWGWFILITLAILSGIGCLLVINGKFDQPARWLVWMTRRRKVKEEIDNDLDELFQ